METFNLSTFAQNNLSLLLSPVQMIVGGIISAIFLRKKNSIETSTQEFEKIKAGLMKEAAESLLKSGKITFSEFYKMDNFLTIAEKADQVFQKKGPIQTMPQQNFDWHVRCYEACGNVSDDQLQSLWAELLAGEIREPDTYSFRTIDCLKNLSKREALLFKRICGTSIATGKYIYIPRVKAYLEHSKITHDDILKLEDCGLVKSDTNLSLTMDVTKNNSILTANSSWLLLVRTKLDSQRVLNKFEIPEYLFTQSGMELYKIIGDLPQNNYCELCKIFRENFSEYEFERGQILKIEGDQIEFRIIRD